MHKARNVRACHFAAILCFQRCSCVANANYMWIHKLTLCCRAVLQAPLMRSTCQTHRPAQVGAASSAAYLPDGLGHSSQTTPGANSGLRQSKRWIFAQAALALKHTTHSCLICWAAWGSILIEIDRNPCHNLYPAVTSAVARSVLYCAAIARQKKIMRCDMYPQQVQREHAASILPALPECSSLCAARATI